MIFVATAEGCDEMKIVVNGARSVDDVPGLAAAVVKADVICAPTSEALAEHLPGAEVLLGWNFRGRELADNWKRVDTLKWIHWCGAGVDAALFPELARSDVALTNARGIFDHAMAEYVLGYMLSEVKLFRETWEHQGRQEWTHRLTRRLDGTKAVILGVGSIGRSIARLLTSVGVEVCGVGRSTRTDDPDFGHIYSKADSESALNSADWAIGVMPLTEETKNYFDAPFFALLQPSAYFINIGRGASLDETALLNALETEKISGAMLDVFQTEPLPSGNPLWTAPNLFVSPHMSGDYEEHQRDMAQQFLDNLELYLAGKPLNNPVDKTLGFARSG